MWSCIAICGKKRHGKDTIGGFIVEYYTEFFKDVPVNKIAFADPIKDITCKIYGLSRAELEQHKDSNPKYRHTMQVVGQEMKKYAGESVWCDNLAHVYTANNLNLITDLRHNHEASFIRSRFTPFIIKVTNNRIPDDGTSGHISETGVTDIVPDVVITNNGSLDELRAEVYTEMHKLHRLTAAEYC
jgi:hypothetical protein